MKCIEEYRLVGGKGDGMRMVSVRNQSGMELTVSLDRAADITRFFINGMNMGYFSPCGYSSPAYCENQGDKWLKTFTAGFLTTCGLESVGSPCADEGEELPLHGSISSTPAEQAYWLEEDGKLVICAQMNDEGLFARKLRLHRKIIVDIETNVFVIEDEILNRGDRIEPVQILYHMNMGYPLLDEDTVVTITAQNVKPRNEHAAEDIGNRLQMEKPQARYEERCYYYESSSEGAATVYQPKRDIGLKIEFDPQSLDCFTEWKMMGVRDYVLGLEPGNCYPDGRDAMRRAKKLKFLEPGEKTCCQIKVSAIS